MILNSVRVRHVGPFTGSHTVDGIGSGLNVLAAPNESGKSTLVLAAIRGLFEKHTVRGQEMGRMQPVGGNLTPSVRIDFSQGGQRYVAAKRFINNPASALYEIHDERMRLLAEGDLADDRLVGMMRGERPGRGASKSVNWGLFQYMWARQGEPVDWFDWGGQTGEYIKQRFARVDIDPQIDRAIQRMENIWSEVYTPKGQSKAGTILKSAQTRADEIRDELKQVREKIRLMEEATRRLQELAPMIESDKSELASARKAVEKARQDAERLRVLLGEVENLKKEQQRAEGELAKIVSYVDKVQAIQNEIKSLEESEARVIDEVRNSENELAALRGKHRDEFKGRDEDAERLAGKEAEIHRLRDLEHLKNSSFRLGELERVMAHASDRDSEIRRLGDELSQLPAILDKDLKILEELDRKISDLDVAMKASGIRLKYEALSPRSIRIRKSGDDAPMDVKVGIGDEYQYEAADRIEIEIPDVGRMDIRSGAEEVSRLKAEQDKNKNRLGELFGRLGITSLDEARNFRTRKMDLENRLSILKEDRRQKFSGFIEENDDPNAAFSVLKKEISVIQVRLGISEDDLAEIKDTDYQSQVQELELHIQEMRQGQKKKDQQIQKLHRAIESGESQLNKLRQKRYELRSQIEIKKGEESQIRSLYTEPLDKARHEAQMEFARAESRYLEKSSQLPENAGYVESAYHRMEKAQSALESGLDKKNRELNQLTGELQARGGEGLHTKEIRLMEELEHQEELARQESSRGRASRLVYGLLKYHKKASTQSMVKPLEDRLTGIFAEISGRWDRRVMLDESLSISGVGEAGSAIAFDQLSQGAREQLMLGLRLSVAAELSEEEPQTLILDDVLVNTDRQRQDRLIQLLESLSGKTQIIILTCHPDWYRGVGRMLTIESCDWDGAP